jgi:hypothetical protein
MDDVLGIILIIAAIVILIYLVKYLFIGALFLFAWAGEQGFIGVAVYFACWIFLFPFMLAGSIITGAFISWNRY